MTVRRQMVSRAAARGALIGALLVAAAPMQVAARGELDARSPAATSAQPSAKFRLPEARVPGRLVVLRAGGSPMDPAQLRPRTRAASPAGAMSDIQVTYTGFPPAAQTAFQEAVNIWESRIVSSVPIQVDAHWTDLGGGGLLGSAGATEYFRFTGGHIYYPAALGEALCACGEVFGTFEITANFNSSFADWYLGTDGNPPADKYDFTTVVLHELGHGLGFLGSYFVSGSSGAWGLDHGVHFDPLPYDDDAWSAASGGSRLTDTSAFGNPSGALKAQLTDGSVYFGGAEVRAANGGNRAELYAPSTWQPGSSLSHFDEDAFPAGTTNALMTPFLSAQEALHDPGPLTLALFRDLGWATSAGSDSTPPIVGFPDADFRLKPVGNNATPVKLRVEFSASDPSGIAATEIEHKIGSAAYVPLAHSPANATAVNRSVATATVHRFRAKATDGAGNFSAFSAAPEFTVTPAQDGSASISEAGSWQSSSDPGFYGGTVRRSTAAGATQTLTLTASDFAFVSTEGPNRGKVRLMIDGASQGTFDLYNSSTRLRRVIFAADFGAPGTHTIQIRVLGTKNGASTGTRVDLDAFMVMAP